MKLTFLGSGGLFTMDNFHSNILLTADSGERLLIDAGTDLKYSLKAAGVSPLDIGAVYISHLHSDHVGGLEWFAYWNYFNGRKPTLFASDRVMTNIWDTLKHGMNETATRMMRLSDYFEVPSFVESYLEAPPRSRDRFVWKSVPFTAVPIRHVGPMLSYGLFFDTRKLMAPSSFAKTLAPPGTVYITTDGTPDVDNVYYDIADVIFHDCEILKEPSGVHAHIDRLSELPGRIKKKMWLYHFQDGPRPDCVARGFRGFVEKGQSFDV